MTEVEELDRIVEAVMEGARYHTIDPQFVRRICAQEARKRRGFRDIVKSARGKLHQVGGAYQEKGVDYAGWKNRLVQIGGDLHDPMMEQFCRETMHYHASTRERLPSLETFFKETLKSIAPIHSIVDVASGLNPLALPWMPVADHFSYLACDIYEDMVDFLNSFFEVVKVNGRAEVCDLISQTPSQPAQVAFVLKTLPCLEQVDKNIAQTLLQDLQAEHLLVSFPARSLGGRSKGMVKNYGKHFEEIAVNGNWKTIQRFEFDNELAFLVSR